MKRRPARKNKKRKIINRGNKKVVYRSLAAIVLFVCSFMFLSIRFAYQRLNQSFANAYGSNNYSYNITEDQFPTLVYAVVSDIKVNPLIITDLQYLIFDKVNKKILIYKIPLDFKFDIAGKYGEEEFSKVLALGGLNSENALEDGANLLKNTVLKIFGFKTDRFIIADAQKRELFDDLLGNGSFLDLLRLKDFVEINDEFKTDLTLEEFYSLFSFVKSIPDDRLVHNTLLQNDLYDSTSLDEALEDIGLNSIISSEGKSIAVLNGTDISGVASLGARIINNIGGRVVALGNADRTYSISMIVTDDKNSQTTLFLSRVFGINNIVNKQESLIRENEVDRSDIVVIMGFDTNEKLY